LEHEVRLGDQPLMEERLHPTLTHSVSVPEFKVLPGRASPALARLLADLWCN
jgi:hypothetical protein